MELFLEFQVLNCFYKQYAEIFLKLTLILI